jgi:RimK family alpha-L-glutamate ligase
LKVVVLYGSTPSRNSIELVETASSRGHTVLEGTLSDISSHISPEGSRFWIDNNDISDASLCFLRSFGPGSTEQLTRRISLVEHFEMAGIKVVNPTYSFRRARDKYSTQVFLKSAGLPVANTFTTENINRAYNWSKEHKDVIYKPILSSMGKGLMRFTDADLAYNAFKMLNRIYQPYILQEYIPNPGRDIRVFVVGKKVVGAAYKYRSNNSWKTNVAQGGKMTRDKVPDEVLELGIKANEIMGLYYSGVDIIESSEGPIILEVNGSPGWQALKEVSDTIIVEEIFNFAESLVNEC